MINFLLLLFAAYGFCTIILFCLAVVKIMVKKNLAEFSVREITVIIPFRDEEHRISDLLDAILKQDIHPYKYLFVNDHSTDNGADKIEKTLINSSVNFQVIALTDQQNGKKAAIRGAMNFVDTEFFLTLDADVRFEREYFKSLEELPIADLYVLPVAMRGSNFTTNLYALDHLMINAVNWCLSVVFPVTASGANLLVRKQTFMELTYNDFHEDIASGDDQFVLRDFRIANKTVYTSAHPKFSVNTPAPKTGKELLDQRMRWIGKTSKMGDLFEISIGFLALVFNLSFYGLTIYYLVIGNCWYALGTFGFKMVNDIIIYSLYFIYQRREKMIALLPVMEFIYPIYMIVIAVLMPFYKPKWKGREIYSKE